MNPRGFVTTIGSVLFLLAMLYADRWIVFERSGFLGTLDEASITLKPCNDSHTSGIGSLVPEQEMSTVEYMPAPVQSIDQEPLVPRSTRAGFGLSSPADPAYWAGQLGAGWYLDWRVQADLPQANLEHWQMVRVHEECITPSAEEVRSTAKQITGQVWIIGNEPDVIWQDSVTPARYAAIYHDLFWLIKTSDPQAKVAVGAISQATPLRLQYLDKVLQTYRDLYHVALPADWWTVHGFVLREEKGAWGVDIPPGMEVLQGVLREISDHGRLDLFVGQLEAFRTWMAMNGYRDTPLALTEFGILMPNDYGFPEDMIKKYLDQTFTWLSEAQDEAIGYPKDAFHLVQKWAWFSLSDPIYPFSNLGDLASGKLTAVGQQFRDNIPQITR
jgi:hypothetical protein